MRGTFPKVNFLAINCFSSSAVSSFLGVNKCSLALLPPEAGREAEGPPDPKVLAGSPDKVAPELELEGGKALPPAALLPPPKAGLAVAPAGASGGGAGNPENPAEPKLKTSGLLNEKDAAETAADSPNPKEVGAEVVMVELEDAPVRAGAAGIP